MTPLALVPLVIVAFATVIAVIGGEKLREARRAIDRPCRCCDVYDQEQDTTVLAAVWLTPEQIPAVLRYIEAEAIWALPPAVNR